MWIRRADYERVLTELAGQRGKRELLDRELAIRQQNVDWLTAYVNRMEVERALLTQRILGVTVPVPVISREPTEHPDLAEALGMGRPIASQDRPDGEAIGIAAAALGLSSFDDMGDALANRLGVKHDGAGNVQYP